MSSSLLCSRRNNNNNDGDGGEPQIIISTPAAAAMRKGPWTDEEDEQLVRFVRLFGERRWDFLAKVSGLRRTGKSCRLRWVNYLHPGLRRGRITADEERRIVELHAQWGSRWSRIARSLPGRTDNEIKNFWRTRTRKMALQERRAAAAGAAAAATATPTPASSSSSMMTTTSECRPGGSSPSSGASSSGSSSSLREERRSAYNDDAELELEEASTATAAAPATKHEEPQLQQEYCGSTMDQLWNEIAAADAAAMSYLVVDAFWGGSGAGHYYYGAAAAEPPPPASPPWECGSDFSLWRIDDQEYYEKMLES